MQWGSLNGYQTKKVQKAIKYVFEDFLSEPREINSLNGQ